MKKLTTLITLVFIALTVLSQKSDIQAEFLGSYGQEMKANIFDLRNIDKEYRFEKQKTQFQLKEVNSSKLKLDSVVAKGNTKEEYFYDENGNVVQYIYYEWEENSWKGSNKDVYSYDTNGNLIEHIRYLWDSNLLKNIMKEEWIFDANANNTQYKSYSWKVGRWVNDFKTDYIHDSLGQVIQTTNSILEGNKWVNSRKNEYSFDSIGNNIQYDIYIWETDHWINNNRIEYSYDSLGKRILVLSSALIEGQLVNAWKDEITYDAEEKTELIVSSNWESEQWMKSYKRESLYNTNDIMINYTSYNREDDTWVESQRFNSVFDDIGNRTSYIYYVWNENQWINDFKAYYLYDNEFSYEDLILPVSNADSPEIQLMFNHKLIQITYFGFDGVDWYVDRDYKIYYSEQNYTNRQDFNFVDQLIVYPNPANNQINFSISGFAGQLFIEIFDTQGKLLYGQVGNNNEPVSIEFLNSGLYFYRISSDGQYYKGKFIMK